MTDTLNRDDPAAPADEPTEAARSGLTRDEKIAHRRHQLRRRRLVGWILLGVLVVLGAAGGYVVWGTALLGLRTVSVTSTAAPLDADLSAQVQDAVAEPTDTPLIRIDLSAVQARVEAVAGVADAAVSRHWPGTLRVEVTPRVPVAAVAANAAIYLLDDTGLPYQTVSLKPATLVDLRLATPGPGDPATMAGLTVVEALPAAIVPQVASVTAGSPYDITIELTDGRSVRWGDTSGSAEKALILPAILRRDGTAFDISDPHLVTVR